MHLHFQGLVGLRVIGLGFGLGHNDFYYVWVNIIVKTTIINDLHCLHLNWEIELTYPSFTDVSNCPSYIPMVIFKQKVHQWKWIGKICYLMKYSDMIIFHKPCNNN